ncbi:MAG: alpha/beta hydrolase [Tissierellia bacterium]|nr:alpha/beta hydrolase [Tissierellia bacterium]
MFYNLIKDKIKINNSYVDYIAFGVGSRNLIIVPGLSVRDLKGAGISLVLMYKCFAKDYRVYLFDRRHDVSEGFSIWDMADDIANAMKQLGVDSADFLGVSQGGMISMALAIKYPDKVSKLVLCATAARPNDTIKKNINNWVVYAKKGDYVSINKETFSLMYTASYLKKYKLIMPFIVRLVKPKDVNRFVILASSILTFDCYEKLSEIKCPVLVIGGECDQITTGEASVEIAEKIGCEIYMYKEYGHAVYEEAKKDFNKRVYDFLML